MTATAEIEAPAGPSIAQWADPAWRLANIYTIIDDEGREVPFVPNFEQIELFRCLHWLNVVLKARQMGLTTLACLMALDQCLFNENFTAAIIADSLPNARKIFRTKVLEPYKKLPDFARGLAALSRESADELVFTNGSSISVGVSARSGTLQFLHVSEMGKISRKYPHKASEIVTGSFEAAQKGIIVVESTAEGKTGWFHDAVQLAKRQRDQGAVLTRLDFRLHFFPWWRKTSNRLEPTGVFLTDADRDYFAMVELRTGTVLDAGQRAWYVKKAATLDDMMRREHPSFEDEAFEGAIDGLVFGKEMRLLRTLGRIGEVPVRAGVPVNTFWDLGVNDTNFIWLHQRVGAMNRFVKCILGHNEGMAHYWRKLQEWREANNVQWGKHYLPHDGDHRIQGHEVKTRKQILEECGAREVKIVPRIPELRDGIEQTRVALIDCEFDASACIDGLDCLDNYSRTWDEDTETWSSQPRDDKYTHGADAFRQFAQGYKVETPRVMHSGFATLHPRSGY